MCGVFGIVSDEDVIEHVRIGLWAQQHRGQESTGAVVYQGEEKYAERRKMGMVDFVFYDAPVHMQGKSGIGHVRYSTIGSSTPDNIQPIKGTFRGSEFCLAHNGNLVGFESLRRGFSVWGYQFSTTTDTEVIAATIHFSSQETFEGALREALRQAIGTYALVALYKDMVIGGRDGSGNRPLAIGQRGTTRFFASESAVCTVLGGTFLREVMPGEMVILRPHEKIVSQKIGSDSPDECAKFQKPCLFEFVYFSRPDSLLNGGRIQSIRERMGRNLWREAPVDADIIVPVPDSGTAAAVGSSRESGIPLEMALFRYHYVGRTFIEKTDARRDELMNIKFNVIPEAVIGKRVMLVDDSIVRARTARKTIKMLKDAGAREVHMRVSSPCIPYPCHYGINTNEIPHELAGRRHGGDLERIREEIGADSLAYLSLDGLKQAVIEGTQGLGMDNFCDACFSGNYHIGGAIIQQLNERL